jgi:hypothetical protein
MTNSKMAKEVEEKKKFFEKEVIHDTPQITRVLIKLKFYYNFDKVERKKGSYLFREGDAPDYIYVIFSG